MVLMVMAAMLMTMINSMIGWISISTIDNRYGSLIIHHDEICLLIYIQKMFSFFVDDDNADCCCWNDRFFDMTYRCCCSGSGLTHFFFFQEFFPLKIFTILLNEEFFSKLIKFFIDVSSRFFYRWKNFCTNHRKQQPKRPFFLINVKTSQNSVLYFFRKKEKILTSSQKNTHKDSELEKSRKQILKPKFVFSGFPYHFTLHAFGRKL